MFGTYPIQSAVDELEKEGVRYFVNLTFDNERNLTPYKTNYTKINYPITDRKIPFDWASFSKFIIDISKIIINLQNNEKIYIHCKGGHGRSGVVVACLLAYIYKISTIEALELTSKFHKERSIMKEKWRNLGSPQTIPQKIFVNKFFEPLLFYRAYKTGKTVGFSNFSLHPVNIPGLGTFPTSEAAFQAHRNLDDEKFINKQKNAKTPMLSKIYSTKIITRPDWDEVKEQIMYNVIKAKFEQNPNICKILLSSGLRPIVYHTKLDEFWGDGVDGAGQNKLGKILTKIRSYFNSI